jgi:hypothetical protein
MGVTWVTNGHHMGVTWAVFEIELVRLPEATRFCVGQPLFTCRLPGGQPIFCHQSSHKFDFELVINSSCIIHIKNSFLREIYREFAFILHELLK